MDVGRFQVRLTRDEVNRVVAGSFDIHLLTSNQWECVAYQKGSNDPGYFKVQNKNMLAAYGYAI
jgi:hypothetical protein